MLDSTLAAIARAAMQEAGFDLELAERAMLARIQCDPNLTEIAVQRAVHDELLQIASRQRGVQHQAARNSDASSPSAIARANGLYETYLIGAIRLGDARRSDIEEWVSEHCARVETAKQRIRFGRKILQAAGLEGPKRVRDVLTEKQLEKFLREGA